MPGTETSGIRKIKKVRITNNAFGSWEIGECPYCGHSVAIREKT